MSGLQFEEHSSIQMKTKTTYANSPVIVLSIKHRMTMRNLQARNGNGENFWLVHHAVLRASIKTKTGYSMGTRFWFVRIADTWSLTTKNFRKVVRS